MPVFRYGLDPLCLFGCAAYAVNRWMIEPRVPGDLVHGYFNDFWLIPCALPLLLWLYRRLRLRAHDAAPGAWEIAWHLVFWSILFEWIGPRIMAHKTGDPRDVLAYAAGALLAGLWWHRRERLPVPEARHEL